MTTPPHPSTWDWDEPTSSSSLLDDAVAAGDTRLLAAAARAGVPLPREAANVVSRLADHGLDAVDTGDQLLLAPGPEAELRTDRVPPPVTLSSMRPRRSLVGVLAACRVQDESAGTASGPFPGRAITVADVIGALGITAADDGRVRHVKGGLRTLATYGLVELVEDRVDDDAPVRLGPQVAAWRHRWVAEDLPVLLAAIDEEEAR